MTPPFDAEAYAEQAARLLGLPILPEWRATVVGHLVATAAAAELVLAFPLEDHDEPAPVFAP
jgi:hypothetical protein